MIVRGTYNNLLYFAEKRTGITEVYPGKIFFERRNLEDTPNALDDWPKKWWEEGNEK